MPKISTIYGDMDEADLRKVEIVMADYTAVEYYKADELVHTKQAHSAGVEKIGLLRNSR